MVSEFGGNRKTPGSISRKDVLKFALRDCSKQNRNRWVSSSMPSVMGKIITFSLLTHTDTHSSLSMRATLLKACNCLVIEKNHIYFKFAGTY